MKRRDGQTNGGREGVDGAKNKEKGTHLYHNIVQKKLYTCMHMVTLRQWRHRKDTTTQHNTNQRQPFKSVL